jgi:hypothetical protein
MQFDFRRGHSYEMAITTLLDLLTKKREAGLASAGFSGPIHDL